MTAPARPDWHVLEPQAAGTPWPMLDAVRCFRGRLLYDDGLRPAFAGGTDGPCDDDPADLGAHHVVAVSGGEPCAALRVLPLDDGSAGFCDRLLGDGATARLLTRLDVPLEDAWEGSGWAVRPGPGRARTAAETLAAGVAVARELGRDTLVGASGTRYGQLHRVLSAGFRRAPGVDPVTVPELADDLQVVLGHVDTLRPEFRALVDRMTPRLSWPARRS
ncbi:hypothetical protein [Pseudonocardia endophytica]|uniref:GNAT family N-acetyltransferase n=1 Tax=Pseudonocardia endophytica TaxID=401976 RepID=A0A4R1HZ32_PSEEN|nr:hypothetical protein [Pseudonocardia endophytica]TCK26821.1 hypothetical protein EV378_2666 [Pseudonocardia endophytica]